MKLVIPLYILCIAILLLLAGCGDPIPTPTPIPISPIVPVPIVVPPAPKPGDILSVDDAEKRIAALQHAREQERTAWELRDAGRASEIEAAKCDKVAADEHQLAVRCFWTAGMLAFLAIVCGVAACFLPAIAFRLAIAAAGLGILSGVCYWVGQHAWIVPWIGTGVIAGLVIWGIWEIRRGHVTASEGLDFGTKMKAIARSGLDATGVNAEIEKLKESAAKAQSSAGVRKLIDRLRAR